MSQASRMSRSKMLRSKVSPGEGTFYGPAKLGINLLAPGYHAMDRPLKGSGKPVVVTVGIKLLKLIDVSDLDELLTVDVLFKIQWVDPRLIGIISKEESPSRVDIMQVWTPGISLANAASPPELLFEGIKLSHDGTVEIIRNGLYSAAVSVDVSLFPFDIQNMEVWYECPDYDGSQVVFLVDKEASTTDVDGEEIWALDRWSVVEDTRTSLVNGDPDSYLVGTAQVRRLFAMSVVTLVAPLYIIANFSFVAFFVYIGDFATRVGIVSTGFLTLIAFMFVVNEHTPKIAYWTWIHAYCGMTIIFVMFVQFLVVLVHFLDPNNETVELQKMNKMEVNLHQQQFDTDIQLARDGARKLKNTRLVDADFNQHDVVLQAKTAFNRVDFNRDGSINREELMSALTVLGHQENNTRKDAEQIIAKYSFDTVDSINGIDGGNNTKDDYAAATMTLPEFITYALDVRKHSRDLEQTGRDSMMSMVDTLGTEKQTCCWMSARHALVIDWWSKRVLTIGFTVLTLLMLLQAKNSRDNYDRTLLLLSATTPSPHP